MITPVSNVVNYVTINNSKTKDKFARRVTTPIQSDSITFSRADKKVSSNAGLVHSIRKALFTAFIPVLTLLGVESANAQNMFPDMTKKVENSDKVNPANVAASINFDDSTYVQNFKPIFLKRDSEIPENIPQVIKKYLKDNKGYLNCAYIGRVESNEGTSSICMLASRSYRSFSTTNDMFDFINSSKPTSFYDEIRNRKYEINPALHPMTFYYIRYYDSDDHGNHLCISVDHVNYEKMTKVHKSKGKKKDNVGDTVISQFYKRNEKNVKYHFTGPYVDKMISALLDSPYSCPYKQECLDLKILYSVFKRIK